MLQTRRGQQESSSTMFGSSWGNNNNNQQQQQQQGGIFGGGTGGFGQQQQQQPATGECPRGTIVDDSQALVNPLRTLALASRSRTRLVASLDHQIRPTLALVGLDVRRS